MSELKQTVRRGARAVALVQIASQLVSIVALAILYRIISDDPPREFGLLAMVLPVVMFFRIFATFGLSVAVVQREELSDAQASALFWLHIVFGALTALVTLLAAPAVAWFYHLPELALLTAALAGISLIAATGAQHQAMLERNLQLGRLAAVRLAAQIAGATAAVAAALTGWGLWALVLQQYVEWTMLGVLAWIVCPWRPGMPRRRAAASPSAESDDGVVGDLRLGGFFSASSVMFFLADNLDKVLVGRLVGAQALGFYSQAYNLAIKPVLLLTSPLTGVILTSLSRAQQDPQTRGEMLMAFYRLVGICLLPVSVGLALVGPQVMRLLGGAAWSTAGPMLSVLALAIVAQGFIHVAKPVLAAAGRTDRLLVGAVAVTILVAQGCVFGWWIGTRYGQPALGVAWGLTLTLLLALFLPFTIFCVRTVGLPAAPLFRSLASPLWASLLMGVLVWLLQSWLRTFDTLSLPVELAIEVAVGAALYAILARGEIRWLVGQWRGWSKENQTEH